MGLVFILVLVPNECQFGTQKLCPAKAKSRTKKKSSQTGVSTPAAGGETAGTTTDAAAGEAAAAAPSADRRFRRLDFVASIPKKNHWNRFDNKVNYYFFFFPSAFLLFCFLQLAGIGPYNYYTPPPPTCRDKWCTKKLLILFDRRRLRLLLGILTYLRMNGGSIVF